MSKEQVIAKMKEIFREVPWGIDHTLGVLKDAEAIMAGENIKDSQKKLICIVAILHDIGALEAQRKYGSMSGEYQEKEGPPIARAILESLNYEPEFIQRVCFVIGNHHTPSRIDGIDFQIQWEADLLANLEHMDIKKDKKKLLNFINENFKTAKGKSIALERFIGV